jgi:hypothetical protein
MMFDETLAVARIVMDLSRLLMIEILEKSGTEGLEMKEVDVGQTRKASDIHLPFFFDECELRAGSAEG